MRPSGKLWKMPMMALSKIPRYLCSASRNAILHLLAGADVAADAGNADHTAAWSRTGTLVVRISISFRPGLRPSPHGCGGVAGSHDVLLVRKYAQAKLARKKVEVGLSQQLLRGILPCFVRLVGIGHDKSAVDILHVHEVRHVVDEGAQHTVLVVQRQLATALSRSARAASTAEPRTSKAATTVPVAANGLNAIATSSWGAMPVGRKLTTDMLM